MCLQLKRVNYELHIHQSAGQQLDVQRALRWLVRGHILAHCRDVCVQPDAIALSVQNIPDDLRNGAPCIGGTKQHTRPCQCHMLPCPGIVALILGKAFDRRAQQPIRAGGPKPRVDFI